MKPDVKKIIADIKATKGNRKYCNGLAGTLQDDNYVSSICKYVKTVTPERIDLLIDYVENLEVKVLDTAEQLANAESKCRELAAESGVLKKAAEFATAPDMWIEQADGMLDYRYFEWYVDVLKAAMETPATDAFLAEVRASAIEHAASERWGSGYVFCELNELAAKIRKGVQS
ncbi:hypothetical protein I5428_23025 [Citrobacter freundii]|uniref:hypothetical protein n=1 Tax=Citrobacter freundii TaxID=546 RepID=UPI0013D0037D|nr:hypothetical protein [Citrobacter freundii]EKU3700974.1 hypothetical protein [Citrobacter freundii]EKX9190261.1 hypothetical protein [Citrobacter freundii]MBJ8913738.1 hypothetical protein [Citrobacter freundii]HCJ7429243.1 hypothetical protein [Citrobacter freundii]